MTTVTNLYPNGRFLGAVAGVVGSGGALPSGAQKSGQSGYTVEVVSVTTVDDYQVLRLKLNYNNASGSDQFPQVEFGDYPTYNNGFPGIPASTDIAAQVYAQAVSGTFPSFYGLNWHEHDASGLYLGNLMLPPFDGTWANRQSTAVTSPTTAKLALQVYVYVPNGANLVDGVIDLAMPMVEAGTDYHRWIPTAGAAVTETYTAALRQPFNSNLLR